MGGFFSVPFSGDQVVKDVSYLSCYKASHIKNLEDNLAAMQKDMEELKASLTDVLRRVEREEDTRSMQRLPEVKVWLKNVDNISRQVSYLLSRRTAELERLSVSGLCSKNSRSNYGYGERVSVMLKKVSDLKTKGFFEVVSEPATKTPTKEKKRLFRSRPAIVGRETILKRALSRLVSGGTRSIGLYGVGGVGKSTILREISNKITARYDIVVWVVMSQDLRVEKIQEEIGKKLGIYGEEWNQKDESQKANDIHNFMKDKRFALLLDDVWTKVDLRKIGVPSPRKKNKCKIAFTTRSREVCVQMGVADPIEVQCLAENDAWDLFQLKVGGHSSKIQEIARKVAERCHGLPLALNVLGETMSCKNKVREWNDALQVLASSPSTESAGTEDEILQILKYSYDSLNGEKLKSCFQYCALFPAGYMLSKDSLVNYWEAEGFLGKFGGSISQNQGYENIDTLVHAGLLMEGDDNTKFVQMHDVVRKMALWVASNLGKDKERWVVQVGVGLREVVSVQDWTRVRRMSLMINEIKEISGSHECDKLTTLFLQQNSNLVRISGEFFQCMPKLVVLNMSFNELKELPEEISGLLALRYLNLSRTKIERLPDGLGALKRLRHLNLEMTKRLKSVNGLSDVSSLGVLRLQGSNVTLDASTIEELQHLTRLESLNIDISSSSALKQLFRAHELAFRIEEVCIRDTQDVACLVLPTTMEKLRKLIIKSCDVVEIEIGRVSYDTFLIKPSLANLSSVIVTGCDGLKDLTWLLFVPKLAHLKLQSLDKVKEILSEERAACEQNAGGTKTPFDKLVRLELSNLPMLKSIYSSPLLFPCLKKIDVEKCPTLRKLPLSSGSCLGGGDELVISYSDDEWMESVQWEDKATEERFLLCCEKVIMPSYTGDL